MVCVGVYWGDENVHAKCDECADGGKEDTAIIFQPAC